jgi:MoxR-like ATPase
MPDTDERLAATHDGPRQALQEALYEIKRVIVGQDAMLERLLVSLLAGGHVLLEGVPGLAKTLTVKTLSQVLGGSFSRVQFTPDLVPADLVGTRIYRPDTGQFDTSLGPVFANFLLADEINRAPAKVQSALLEVMQERQVTIAGTTYPVPSPFIVMATQNPIESEGTYPLPEAQVDRFLMKIVVDYPSAGEEAAVVGRSLGEPPPVRELLSVADLTRYAEVARSVLVDRDVIAYAVALADATRPRPSTASRTSRRSSSTAPAPAARSGWSRRRASWRCCAAAGTPPPTTSATWPATCCATASCCPTTRSARA